MRLSLALVASVTLLTACQPASHRAMMGCPAPERKPEPDEAVVTERELIPCRTVFRGGDRVKLEYYAPETLQRMDFGQSLTLNDINNLSAFGFCDEMIFYQIERTGTQLTLTPQEVAQLEMWDVRPSIVSYLKKRFEDRWFNPYLDKFSAAKEAAALSLDN